MQMNIFIRDMSKTESMETYLQEKIGLAVETFMKNDENAQLTVRVEMDRHRTLNRKPSFICEVLLKPSYQKRTIKVLKHSDDLHDAIVEASDALRTILSRRSGRKAQHRRHQYEQVLKSLSEIEESEDLAS